MISLMEGGNFTMKMENLKEKVLMSNNRFFE